MIARDAERGQTLPIWTLAVLTALTLMFFLLNYANVIRAQVRAQNAADGLAHVMLSTQATRWNKITLTLYAADVEEWRIRTLMQAMIDAAQKNSDGSQGNGGCGAVAGNCLLVYNALQNEFYQAVNRYTADAWALDAYSYFPEGSLATSDVTAGMRAYVSTACSSSPVKSSNCNFKYHTIDFSHRPLTAPLTAWPQVAKDALYAHVGGITGALDSTPYSVWQPVRVEVSACETVAPLVPFSILGQTAQPVQIIGRAAATIVPITSEWLAPGVTLDPNLATPHYFQPYENYIPSVDIWTSSATPRDWYETTYPAQPYTAQSNAFVMTNNQLKPDFEVFAAWWGVIPILPYTTTTQSSSALCTQDAY
jgi:hypothetical protein